LHLIIATIATRGNVQPYVALGKVLRQRGHVVTVATHEDYRSLVETNSLNFRSVCGSYHELLASPHGKTWINSSTNPIAFMKGAKKLLDPLMESWIEQFDSAFEDADCAVVHAYAIPALTALERRNIPKVIVFPSPAAIPGAMLQSIGMPRIPILSSWAERTIFGYLLDQLWLVGKEAQEAYLASHGLAQLTRQIWRENLRRGIGHLHLFSEKVVPRPWDWPPCAEITGYCFLDAESNWKPPNDLTDFIQAGPPPIYVTYGSQSGLDPHTLASITRDALQLTGQRAVVGLRGAGSFISQMSENMFFTENVPYEWLFPQMSTIVHYGGAGTASAALRAGRPSVVIPFYGDQNFWARRLRLLGVCPTPIPKRQLCAERLASALHSVYSVPSYTQRASEISREIRSEDGLNRSADRVLHYLHA
jgi:sterol 3beta-glucosyltransferase